MSGTIALMATHKGNKMTNYSVNLRLYYSDEAESLMAARMTISAAMDLDELVGVLGSLCTRDEAGRHFTETADEDDLDALEKLGWIEVHRPIHEATGIPYGPEHWTLTVTEDGIEAVETSA